MGTIIIHNNQYIFRESVDSQTSGEGESVNSRGDGKNHDHLPRIPEINNDLKLNIKFPSKQLFLVIWMYLDGDSPTKLSLGASSPKSKSKSPRKKKKVGRAKWVLVA